MHCIESWEYDDQWMAKKLEQCLVPILTEICENDHFVIFMIVTIYCEPAIDDVNQCNFVDRGIGWGKWSCHKNNLSPFGCNQFGSTET